MLTGGINMDLNNKTKEGANMVFIEEIKMDGISIMEEGIQPGGALCGLGCIAGGVWCGIGCPK